MTLPWIREDCSNVHPASYVNHETRAAMSSPRTSRLTAAAATLGGNLFIVVGSLVLGCLAILFAWVPPKGRWVFLMARLWSRGLLATSGLRLTVRRETELGRDRCYIFMPNHQSLYDIPALIASLPVPAFFFAKRSLFKIPVFGWAIRAGGFVSIDRKDRSQAAKGFALAMENLRRGLSTVIFPEGTRSLDGEMLPFERGGFLLALKSGSDIVPVAVRGTLEVRRRGSMRIRPGRIEVRYGSPLAVKEFDVRERGRLAEVVEQEIASLLRRGDTEQEK